MAKFVAKPKAEMDFALQFIFNPQDLTLLESWQSMQVNDLLESIKIMQQDKQ